MDGEWEFQVQLSIGCGSPMEETLIETFGCVTFTEKVIKVYVSYDARKIRRDLCMEGKVVDSQTTLLPNFYENPLDVRAKRAVESRLAAA